ncbi:MAG: cytochrome c [Sulfuritalea sp.]|jgi:mono/diheme cytochrome c family protein|nr:cytochrome c [Sulfuritalea sp.]
MKRFALAALAAVMGSLGPGPAMAVDEGSVVRGGRLYDNWNIESKNRPPNGPHPAFTIKGSAVSTTDTWRCSTCHGWDYKGKHGYVGIRNRQGADPSTIVALLKNATHRYGGLMGEASLLDLANFVSHGQIDTQKLIETEHRAKTNVASYEEFYGTICAACHGSDGGRLREVAPIGDAARQRPHEVLHNLINGHPGDVMPPLSALGGDFAVRMLTYVQTLPSRSMSVSVAHGARMYDNWQVETGALPQALPHPAYPSTAHFAADAPTTWRCKECHGWDYAGKQGQYASGHHATGIKGIRGMAGADPARIVAVLRDSKHRFDAVLKARDLLDLANFVSVGQIDMNAAIDQRGRARGNAARAGAHYRTICATCHGIDGQRIITAPPLGRVARANPWEGLHKIANGHPNEKMPALRKLDPQLLIDILAHLQGLPETR